MSKWVYTEAELWRYGERDYSIFHVFSAVVADSAVLVFSEGRKEDGSDAACPHDILMKKSLDGGRSFPEERCLLSADGVHCWANPCPLFDRQTGRLFLFFTDNQKNVKTENYYVFSDDLGSSWSAPVCITPLLGEASNHLPFHLSGPGHGIALKRGPFQGRLLMQFWHRSANRTAPSEERGYCASVLYSDDHGKTWQNSPLYGKELLSNESRLAETAEGVFWAMRTRSSLPAFSFSRDGVHWDPVSSAVLPEARCCDLGLTSLSAKVEYEDLVLLSRVSHPTARRDLEILLSRDGGRSFSERFALMPGDAMPGYSDLCVIEEEEPVIGLLHSRDNHVLFSRISLQTLTGGAFDGTTRSVWLE
ncbi:MAG: exo-alpha-sialidase [Clostridia bacterium]|nr:exo-alpha-sialidase [Clostridia bacterium]